MGMTEQQAIYGLKLNDEQKKRMPYAASLYEVAINALEDVQQYRALGTVEELKEAKEKQTAKKPIEQHTDEKVHYKCYCGYIFQTKYKDTALGVWGHKTKFCERCGQKVDWGNEYEY